jgi:uncharacterized membrane protein SirB2
MTYVVVKGVHLLTVGVTIVLFILRGGWMAVDSARLRARWVRVVPHVNDALLLASGIALVAVTGRYRELPLWLVVKLAAVIIYVGLGMLALRPALPKGVRVAAWVMALAMLGFIVSVATTQSPMPFV